MRSHQAARVLSRRYRLHHVMLHYPLRKAPPRRPVPPFVSVTPVPIRPWMDPHQLFFRILYEFFPGLYARLRPGLPSEHRFVTGRGLRLLASRLAQIPYRRVYIHRIYMLAFALPFLTPRIPFDLDLDDIESLTRGRLAQLARSLGRAVEAAEFERDSRLYARLEAQLLPRAERVFVCSDLDARRLEQTLPGLGAVTMPNVVPLPEAIPWGHPPELELLFVGALNYLPNWDACLQLATSVLPALDRLEVPYRLHLVGGSSELLPSQLLSHPRVRALGYVDRLEPFYARATAAVVPLRAGGGTRLKILEAMAHGCPVVSTVIGAEGLNIRPGVHFLQADDGEAFAGACLRLHAEPEMRREIAQAGRRFVENYHHPDLIDQILLNPRQ